MSNASTIARQRKRMPATRHYGILRVYDGGTAEPQIRLSRDLLDLAITLKREASAARKADQLIEKYEGGAGKDHPSRKADFDLWTERYDRWQAAALSVAAYRSFGLNELRFKANLAAIELDFCGAIAEAVARELAGVAEEPA